MGGKKMGLGEKSIFHPPRKDLRKKRIGKKKIRREGGKGKMEGKSGKQAFASQLFHLHGL